jgi:hypothetical protein
VLAMVTADRDVVDRKGYDDLFQLDPLLWQELRNRDPYQVCMNAWVEHEKGRGFRFFFLNQECLVNPSHQTILFREERGYRMASFQEALVALTYTAKASPIAPSGRMVTEKELKGGGIFFQGPHALLTRPLLNRYSQSPREFMAAGISLGGAVQEYGQAAFKLRPLPKVPVSYILYQGDEEFEASMVVTFDDTIEHHLPLDVIWALVNVTSMRLMEFNP